MTYLNAWLGIREIGSLEPKPGVPPTTAHMSELLARLAKRTGEGRSCAPPTTIRARRNGCRSNAKIPVVTLPFTVGGDDKAKDLFGLFDDTLARLLAAAK